MKSEGEKLLIESGDQPDQLESDREDTAVPIRRVPASCSTTSNNGPNVLGPCLLGISFAILGGLAGIYLAFVGLRNLSRSILKSDGTDPSREGTNYPFPISLLLLLTICTPICMIYAACCHRYVVTTESTICRNLMGIMVCLTTTFALIIGCGLQEVDNGAAANAAIAAGVIGGLGIATYIKEAIDRRCATQPDI